MAPEKKERNDRIEELARSGMGYRLIRDTLAREGHGTLSLARIRQVVKRRLEGVEL